MNEKLQKLNLLTKSHRYVNVPRDKTVKARRLKMLESIDKSLSELLKTANQTKVWFLSYINSKKLFLWTKSSFENKFSKKLPFL
jgi:hypothetical protein